MSMKIPGSTERPVDPAAGIGSTAQAPATETSTPSRDIDGGSDAVKTPWAEKKKLNADQAAGSPSPYPAHLRAVFDERPDLESRWQLLHEWLADPEHDAVDSAQYETYEAINEDNDMPKLQVMLAFLHGQLGNDGLKAFVSETVKRLVVVSGKQDGQTLLEQWPVNRWGELPDRAELEAVVSR